MPRDIPSQVRIRTDAEDGYGHRYDSIQAAKRVFGVGNNTDAILHGCDHAKRDLDAKQDALEYLTPRLPSEQLAEVATRLATPAMPLTVP